MAELNTNIKQHMVSSQKTASCSLMVRFFWGGPAQDELGLMVSVPQSPWLGVNAKPPEEHGVPKGKPQRLGAALRFQG